VTTADETHLRVSSTCRIALAELSWTYTGSGGPGGQHANTANTRVEVVFDIEGSPSLAPRQRERLLERCGATLRIVASDTRSQSRNRELALERLRARLAEGLRVQAPRRATKPTASAKRARLDTKRKRSDTKQQRRRPSTDD
jgi:ribosome-associated protein